VRKPKRTARRIMLFEDGIFVADCGHKEDRYLAFDGDTPDGTWIFSISDGDQSSTRFVERYADLDKGLQALAEDGDFEVMLTNGTSFKRPGHVPASTILVQLGYRITKRVHIFAVIDGPDDADPDEMRLAAGRRIMGTTGNIVAIDSIGEGDGWCVEIALPFEGVFDGKGMKERIEAEMAETNLEIAEFIDEEELKAQESEVGNVVSLFRKGS
jgi:hypothetical protein